MSKSTKIETEKRVFTVQGWIIQGVPDYLILKQCVDQWNISDRQAKNYLAKGYKLWREASAATVEERRQLKIDKLKQDIRGMKDSYKGTPMGMRVVLQYEKEINRLEGIIPAKEHVIKGDPEQPIVLKDANTRDARIDELIAKYMQRD